MYEQIIKMIGRLFSDTSRPASDTLDDLYGIRDEVEMKIEAIKADMGDEW